MSKKKNHRKRKQRKKTSKIDSLSLKSAESIINGQVQNFSIDTTDSIIDAYQQDPDKSICYPNGSLVLDEPEKNRALDELETTFTDPSVDVLIRTRYNFIDDINVINDTSNSQQSEREIENQFSYPIVDCSNHNCHVDELISENDDVLGNYDRSNGIQLKPIYESALFGANVYNLC
ncbi:hypothetical protein QR98_0012180 [Sarcoptes scabiei]|uniref:Uncharacterized protein n=1 Tax=Sarcoptes scabiei TaxID=52283 RepID=A0A131ZVX5_SARSC|nr:hypothetical protein QR98_0012180 [Sarcoptes scabiei]